MSGLKTGKDFRRQVWKWHVSVWNRVGIWRTRRHTPTTNSEKCLRDLSAGTLPRHLSRPAKTTQKIRKKNININDILIFSTSEMLIFSIYIARCWLYTWLFTLEIIPFSVFFFARVRFWHGMHEWNCLNIWVLWHPNSACIHSNWFITLELIVVQKKEQLWYCSASHF